MRRHREGMGLLKQPISQDAERGAGIGRAGARRGQRADGQGLQKRLIPAAQPDGNHGSHQPGIIVIAGEGGNIRGVLALVGLEILFLVAAAIQPDGIFHADEQPPLGIAGIRNSWARRSGCAALPGGACRRPPPGV